MRTKEIPANIILQKIMSCYRSCIEAAYIVGWSKHDETVIALHLAYYGFDFNVNISLCCSDIHLLFGPGAVLTRKQHSFIYLSSPLCSRRVYLCMVGSKFRYSNKLCNKLWYFLVYYMWILYEIKYFESVQFYILINYITTVIY